MSYQPLLQKNHISTITEQNRSIYIIWKPYEKVCPHQITMLNSGNFEVVCCHQTCDRDTIRKQIKLILQTEETNKKNN
jgi:hypothetical protein